MPSGDDKKGRPTPGVPNTQNNSPTVVGAKNPLVQRGGQDTGSDPERSRETQVGRGKAGITVPLPKRRPRPIDDGVPSASNPAEPEPREEKSVSQKSKSGVGKRSVVSWVAPPGELSARHHKREPSGYRTGHDYEPIEELRRENAAQEEDEADRVESVGEEEFIESGQGAESETFDDPEVAPGALEGDGLEALDPDLPTDSQGDEGGEQATPGTRAGLESAASDEEDGAATRAGRPLKLEIIAGPDKGESRRFKGVRMVIGRTSGIEVQLSDQSVSRRHVELVVSDTGVLLRDLQSGNGTKVNGEKVEEKLLVHGDVITIGKTQLRLVDEVAAFEKLRAENEAKEREAQAAAEAEAAAKAEEEVDPASEDDGEGDAEAEGESDSADEQGDSSEQDDGDRVEESAAAQGEARAAVWWNQLRTLHQGRPLRWAVSGAAALVLLLLGAWLFRPTGKKAEENPRRIEAVALMDKARQAMAGGRFDEAVGLIAQAEKAFPGVDQNKLGAQATNELKNQEALDAIATLIDDGKLEEAKAALSKLAPGTSRAEARRKELEQRLAGAQSSAVDEKIERWIAAGDLEMAEAALKELPAGPEKAALTAKLEEARRMLTEALEEEQRLQAQAASTAAVERDREEVQQRVSAFAIVQRKFLGNDWVRAAAECDRVIEANPGNETVRKKAKALQSQIPLFGKLFDEGMRKFNAGQLVQAAPILKEARKVYEEMGLESSLGRELEEKVTQTAISAGKDALLRDDLASAVVYFREALSVEPKNTVAQAGLDEVMSHAEDVYQEGYGLRGINTRQASLKFKLVMQITPKNSDLYKRAEKQLSGLAKPAESSP